MSIAIPKAGSRLSAWAEWPSAEDAYGHLCAGASLVELYTGLIYEGPGLPSAIKDGLLDLMRRDGHSSITQVIGKSNRPT